MAMLDSNDTDLKFDFSHFKPPRYKSRKPPSYCRHGSGQARVVVQGRTYYLGKYGSPMSKKIYEAFVRQWWAWICELFPLSPQAIGRPNQKERSAYNAMLHRCLNPNSLAWKNYGGRGIKVYEPWQDSFEVFFRHIGAAPSRDHSLDRIDNDGNYEPGNVRWATKSMQARNRRRPKHGLRRRKYRITDHASLTAFQNWPPGFFI